MARRRSRLKSRLLSASSELRKGFAIPTKKRIFSALSGKSKHFIMELFWSAFIKLPKSAKITLLMRIDRVKSRKTRKRKSKGRTRRRKTKRKARRRKTKARKSKRRKSRKGKKVSFVTASGKRVSFTVKR